MPSRASPGRFGPEVETIETIPVERETGPLNQTSRSLQCHLSRITSASIQLSSDFQKRLQLVVLRNYRLIPSKSSQWSTRFCFGAAMVRYHPSTAFSSMLTAHLVQASPFAGFS